MREYSTTEIVITGVFAAVGAGLLGAAISYHFLHSRLRSRQGPASSDLLIPIPERFNNQLLDGPVRLDLQLERGLFESTLHYDLKRLDDNITSYGLFFHPTSSNKNITHHDESVLEKIKIILGSDNVPYQPHEIVELLGSAKDREAAVTFLIAWVILSNVSERAEADHTLLPPEIAGFMRLMNESPRIDDNPLLNAKWRQITGMYTKYKFGELVPKNWPDTDSRQPNMTRMTTALDEIFQHYSPLSTPEKRSLLLREIVIDGAILSFLLFRTPMTYTWSWTRDPHRADGVREFVTFPSFTRVKDDLGRSLRDPVLLRVQEIHTIEKPAS